MSIVVKIFRAFLRFKQVHFTEKLFDTLGNHFAADVTIITVKKLKLCEAAVKVMDYDVTHDHS